MDNIIFYDVKEAPFELYGLYNPLTEEKYMRMPDEAARNASNDVWDKIYQTAGGRVRFATDSENLVISFDPVNNSIGPHYTPLLGGGFDLYCDSEVGNPFVTSTRTRKLIAHEHIEYPVELGPGMKEFTLNFPLYGGVKNLKLGFDEGAAVRKHRPYTHTVPIVYYGSSITQGACASRPGTCYEAIISRMLDCDYINLGFNGSAKGEKAIAEYIASLNMSAFVCDYDHNADPPMLAETHFRMYEIIREKHPDMPYFMVSRPDYRFFSKNNKHNEMRVVIMESYLKAYGNGDKNVWFVDGAAFFAGDERGDCTMEGTHPTDLGFRRMANNIGDALKNVLKW